MIGLLLVLVLADPAAITVESGTVVVAGVEQKVGPGTFIPAPLDTDLAKKVVDLQTAVAECRVEVNTCKSEASVFKTYHETETKKITDFYVGKVAALQDQVDDLNGWWSSWGKPVGTAILGLLAGAAGTYLIDHR